MTLYPDEHFQLELDEQQKTSFGEQLAEEVVAWVSTRLEVEQVFPAAEIIKWVQANPTTVARNIPARHIYTRKQLIEALNEPG